MKKFFISLLGFVLVGSVGVVLAKDWILKVAVEQGVSALTGFPTKVDSLQYDFPSTLRIQGLEIQNPEGFNEKVFANLPEIYVSLVLPELLQGKRIHLREVRLNIQEIHLEKSPQGISNIQLLSSVGGAANAPPPRGQPAAPAQPKGEGKPSMAFLLERLELTIRNVSYQDHSSIVGRVPVNKLAVDLNVEKEVFANIQDPQVLVNLILVKILRGATFGKLLNLNPEQLVGKDLSQVLSSGKEFVGKQAAAITDQAGALTGEAAQWVNQAELSKKAGIVLQDSLGGAKGAVGDTTAAARQKISGFLEKLKSVSSTDNINTASQ